MSRTDEELKRWLELSKLSESQLLAALRFQEEEGWQEVVQQLHLRGGQLAFEFAKEVVHSRDHARQVVGARILGQLGGSEHPYRDASIPILRCLLDSESSVVQAEAIVALGHLRAEQAEGDLILKISSEDDLIRRSLAFALGQIGGPEAVEALGHLIKDANEEVVEWALWGLQDEQVLSGSVKKNLNELVGSANPEISKMASDILENLTGG